jgi:3-hydroxyisobutyrate dehydrogenase-like beta-hydroxyacid dehydrogenase
MNTRTVGFLGLGAMGRPMALNLLKAGHEVIAYDTDPARLGVVTGAGAAHGGSAADAAGRCDVVCMSLTDSETFVAVAESQLISHAG